MKIIYTHIFLQYNITLSWQKLFKYFFVLLTNSYLPLFSQQPSCAVTAKKFTYLLVKTGTLMLKACSDLRGYTPGQIIKLSTEIHNKSGKDTGYVMASLIQVRKIIIHFFSKNCGWWFNIHNVKLSDNGTHYNCVCLCRECHTRQSGQCLICGP